MSLKKDNKESEEEGDERRQQQRKKSVPSFLNSNICKSLDALPLGLQAPVLAEAHQVLEEITLDTVECVAKSDWEGVSFALRRLDAAFNMRYKLPQDMAERIITAVLPAMMAPDLVPQWHFIAWSSGLVRILSKEHQPLNLKGLDWALLQKQSDQRIPRKSVIYSVHTAKALGLQSLLQLLLSLQPHTDASCADAVIENFRTRICPHFPGDTALCFLRAMVFFPVQSATDAQVETLLSTAISVAGWKHSPQWATAVLSTVFRVAKHRRTMRWNRYAEFVYNAVLGSFQIPAGCSDTGYPRFVSGDEVGVSVLEADLEARICISILDGDVEDATWKFLVRLLRSTDVLHYVGSRSLSQKIADFVSSLTKFFSIRVQKQKKWLMPETKLFYEKQLDYFAEILLPSMMCFFESKHSISRHGVLCLGRLSKLAPRVTCKAFLPSKVEALAQVTDHKVMITLLEGITDVLGFGISAQVPEVFACLQPFMVVVLEGINANNIARTLASLLALRTILMRIPLDVDTEGCPHVSALMEEWALSIVTHVLVFAQSYTESKLSTDVERELRLTLSVVYATMSEDIVCLCLRVVTQFISNNLCLSTRKIVGNLIAVAVERLPHILPNVLRPFAQSAIPSLPADVARSDVDWHGYMYARALSTGGEGVLDHIPEVEAIVQRLMETTSTGINKWRAKAAGKLVYNTLRALTEIRPTEHLHVNPGTVDARCASSWGRLYYQSEAQITWRVPSDRAVNAASAFSLRLFTALKEQIETYLRSLTAVSEQGSDNILVKLVLLRYLVQAATPIMKGAPWKDVVPKCIDLSEGSSCFSYAEVIELCKHVVTSREFVSVKCLNLITKILLATISTRGGTTRRKVERRRVMCEKISAHARSHDGRSLRVEWLLWAHYNLLRRYVALTHIPYEGLVQDSVGILFNLSTGIFSIVRKKAQAAMGAVARLLLRKTRRQHMVQWLSLFASVGAALKEETVTGVCHLMQSSTYLTAFAEEQDLIRELMITILMMPNFDRKTIQVRIHATFEAVLGHLWEIEVHTKAELLECERSSDILVSQAYSDSWTKTDRAQSFAMFFVRIPNHLRPAIRVASGVYRLMFENLAHPIPQVALNAQENVTKLCCVFKASHLRVELPYDPKNPNRPFVDDNNLGFATLPATVHTFDLSGKVCPSDSPFAPTREDKAAFSASLEAALTPDVFSRLVTRRSTEAKSSSFMTSQARFWKGILRALGASWVEKMKPKVAHLIDQGCTNNTVQVGVTPPLTPVVSTALTFEGAAAITMDSVLHTCQKGYLSCACEILAGIARASRHWERAVAEATMEYIASMLETMIMRAAQESFSDICSALSFATIGLDPRRYEAIQRVLLDKEYFTLDEPTLALKCRLQLADRLLENCSWRCDKGRIMKLLTHLTEQGMRQQHQVRMAVATLIATCIEYLWNPNEAKVSQPQVTQFFICLRDSVHDAVARHNSGEMVENPKQLQFYWDTAFRVVMLVIGRGSVFVVTDCVVMFEACIAYLNLEHSDVVDDDLTVVVTSCVKKLMHSHLSKDNVTSLLVSAADALPLVTRPKAAKICLLFFLEGIVYANQYALQSKDVDAAIDGICLLLDDKFKIVRDRAADAIAFLLRMCSHDVACKRAAAFAALCKSPKSRLQGVVGLRAVATAYPDCVPNFIPPTLCTLGRYVGDRDGDVSSTVKETFTAWWSAHNAAWNHGQKELFSEAQRDIVQELVYSTSYFV